MTGLNTKEQAIIDLLTETNVKLDSIITALGSVPTPPTHNLDDIYDLIVTSNTNTTSIDTTLTNLDTNINSLYVYLVDELSLILENIGQMKNNLFYGLVNLGLTVADGDSVIGGWLFDMQNLLGLVSGAIGLPIDANNRNVIELLAEIDDRPLGNPNGGLVPQSVCDDAYISTEMTLVPGLGSVWTGTIWAVFPDPPPSPLDFGTTFGIGVDRTELVISGDSWAGWKLYVASEAANYGRYLGDDSALTTARFPTNVWLDLTDWSNSLSVFTLGEASVRAYLCTGVPGSGGGGGGPWGGGSGGGGPWEPLPDTWTDPIDIVSSAATYFTNFPSSQALQATLFSTIPSVSCADDMSSTGGLTEGYNDVSCGILTGQVAGCTVELLSGSAPVLVILVYGDTTRHYFSMGIASPATISGDAVSMLICNAGNSAQATTPFTVRITPP